MASRDEIESLVSFLIAVKDNPSPLWIYRGQSNASHPLKPKAGRPGYFQANPLDRDLNYFYEWCKQSAPYGSVLPESLFERLALAQHYGLATRMLDWTTNPLVALYFAVEVEDEKDGVVVCYSPTGYFYPHLKEFWQVEAVVRYDPPPFDARIRAQSGIFTYHPFPSHELVEEPKSINFRRLVVPSKAKGAILTELAEIDITRRTLFPGLDGLSQWMNWQLKSDWDRGWINPGPVKFRN